MKYIVYQTVNKINGKLYIGVHKTENPDIFDGYIGCGVKIGYQLKHPKTTFQYAVKKYGYKNFIRTVLFTYDTENEAYAKEAEIVTLKWVKDKNNYNTKVGGIHGFTSKTLYQFNYKGELIKEWDSCLEAIEFYGCGHTRFRDAINNKYSAFESYWSYDKTINICDFRKAFRSECYQYTIDGDLVKVWPSLKDIQETLGYNRHSISEAKRKKSLYKNFYWTNNEDDIFEVIKLNQLFNLKNKNIIQYDKNFKELNTFNSIKEASKIINIKYGTIKAAIRKKTLVANTFYFAYVSNINNKNKIQQFDLKGNLIKIWDSLTQCAKIHPKCREVLKGTRSHTHGYTFKYL